MKGFILGLGIGLAIGILYAPQEGSKSRTDFSERADGLLARVDEVLDKTKKAAREGFESAVAAHSKP
ncbi:MAG: YtxH domain-containing protein [Acidobacteriota bacterium]|nr:YtxH domain-containing protein [Acidobacteriota bacterium]